MSTSFVMTEQESPFEISELFFSMTNRKGIILSGNSVFKRVSSYEWSEMIGRPHNLVRHPEMPKGVFRLLWDNLLNERPVAAYVKNRAKDGRPYWVFALALPYEDKYISIRLKPSSAIFDLIKGFYRQLSDREQKDQLTPEQSKQKIEEQVKALGFDDYDHFMTHALAEEMKSRQEKLGGATKGKISHTFQTLVDQQKLVALSEEISKATQLIIHAYSQNQYVSLNLQIEALQNSSGQTMGKVAEHLQKMSGEVEKQVVIFDQLASQSRAELRRTQFLLLASQLVDEMHRLFSSENSNGFTNIESDQVALKTLSDRYNDDVAITMRKTQDVLRRFGSSCAEVTSINNGLEIIRLTGKIEASHTDEWAGCLGIINGLQEFLAFSKKTMSKIQDSHQQMQRIVERISESLAN